MLGAAILAIGLLIPEGWRKSIRRGDRPCRRQRSELVPAACGAAQPALQHPVDSRLFTWKHTVQAFGLGTVVSLLSVELTILFPETIYYLTLPLWIFCALTGYRPGCLILVPWLVIGSLFYGIIAFLVLWRVVWRQAKL